MGLSGIFEQCSDKNLIKAVINCLDKGVNFIDTARDYGDSKKKLGKVLKVYNGEKPFISTKIQSKEINDNFWNECCFIDVLVKNRFFRKWFSKKYLKR